MTVSFEDGSADLTIAERLIAQLKTGKKGASLSKFDPLSLKEEWKHPGLKYRWVLRDNSMEIYKRQQQGYVFADPTSGGAITGPHEGNGMGSTPVARELVLMVNHAEWAQEYQDEIAKRTNHSERSINSKTATEELRKIQSSEGIDRGPEARSKLIIE
jgi:hypothetical protein